MNIQKRQLWVLCLIGLLLFSQCSLMYRVLLGVDTSPNWCSDKHIERDYKRFGIKHVQRLVLDTASYEHWVRERLQPITDSIKQAGISKDSDTAKRLVKPFRDDMQPVQFRYFTASGQPLTKLVNCYIDPPIPMRWNIDGSFNQHPPRHNIAMLNDHQQDLHEFLPHLHGLNGHKPDLSAIDSADYVALVFFNRFMFRPSRKLIKTLETYRAEHPDVRMTILYVHNQNSLIWPRLNDKQKEQVRSLR